MKIYLAGPDVFRPDAAEWFAQARDLCRQHGYDPITPLDHGETKPGPICAENLALIRKAQIVVANLNSFRGAEPDSGTAFELGYAHALGKKLWGYMSPLEDLIDRVIRIDGTRHPTDEAHPIDRQGRLIENFGLPVNLMLAMSMQLVEGDLAACLSAIRPRTKPHLPEPHHAVESATIGDG